MGDTNDKELLALQRARRTDRRQFSTKRYREGQNAPSSFGEILPALFRDAPETLHKFDEHRAMNSWKVYVGESAAQVSDALKIRNGKLIVRVADPVWMHQLSLCKSLLVSKFRKDFPALKITDIFFIRG